MLCTYHISDLGNFHTKCSTVSNGYAGGSPSFHEKRFKHKPVPLSQRERKSLHEKWSVQVRIVLEDDQCYGA
jgi:hypothetical protein